MEQRKTRVTLDLAERDYQILGEVEDLLQASSKADAMRRVLRAAHHQLGGTPPFPEPLPESVPAG